MQETRRSIWRFRSGRAYVIRLEHLPNGVYVITESSYGPTGPDPVDPDVSGNWSNYTDSTLAHANYEGRVQDKAHQFGRVPDVVEPTEQEAP